MNVTLSDGTVAALPDGLSDDAIKNFTQRLEAANSNAKASASQSPAPPSPPSAPPTQQPKPQGGGSWLDWFRSQQPLDLPQPDSNAPTLAQQADAALGGYPSAALNAADRATGGWLAPPARMAANVAADVLGIGPSALAAGANALAHTAENFGLAEPGPSLPILSDEIKRATGVRPYAQDEGVVSPATLENVLAIAAGNWRGGAPILSSLVKGVTGDIAQGVGGWLGGKAANAVDPQGRLTELGQMTGALAPGLTPRETIASPLLSRFRAPNAGDIYDRTQALGAVTGNPDLTPTAGMVGSPGVAAFERAGAAFPFLNIPIKSAQGGVANALERGVANAAEAVAPMREGPLPQGALGPGAPVKTLPDTTPGAPGALLQQRAQDELTRRWNDAKSAIDQAETAASLTNLRDANGNPALVKGPALQALFNTLGGLTSQTVNERPIPISVGSGGDAANSAAGRLRSALTPQDPVLDRNLNAALNSTQAQLANPSVPAAAKPALNAQARSLQQQIDANMGVSFEALRRLKSEIGSSVDQGSVDSFTGNQITGAMTDALQSHLDAVDPALGQRYRAALGQYNDAMKYREDLTGPGVVNAVGTPKGPGQYLNPPGQTDLTNRIVGFLRNPERAGVLPQTPGWRDAVAALVASLGRQGGQFDPKTFLQQWGDTKLGGGQGSTPKGRALFTQPSPEAAWLLDHATDVSRALEQGPERHGGESNLAGPLATTAIAEHVMGTHGLGSSILGGLASTLGLERPGTIRALAGRPAPYFQQTSPLPALLAIAQAQGRNQY
jgi:hypothetical protein